MTGNDWLPVCIICINLLVFFLLVHFFIFFVFFVGINFSVSFFCFEILWCKLKLHLEASGHRVRFQIAYIWTENKTRLNKSFVHSFSFYLNLSFKLLCFVRMLLDFSFKKNLLELILAAVVVVVVLMLPRLLLLRLLLFNTLVICRFYRCSDMLRTLDLLR